MIPRLLWQSWKSRQLPPRARACHETWLRNNPRWTAHLFDDGDIRRFFEELDNQRLFEVYRKLPFGVMRADFWRYAVIYYRGGFYADIDTSCHRPLDSWIPESAQLLVAHEPTPGFLCQWAFGAERGHPAIRRLLDRICERVEQGIEYSPYMVHHYTGPSVFTEIIRPEADRGARFYPWQHFTWNPIQHHYGGGGGKEWEPEYEGWKHVVLKAAASYVHSESELVFSQIYKEHSWGTGTTPVGSTPKYCAPLVDFLRDYLRDEQIRALCDVGCGDFAWMPIVLEGLNVRYVGVDCVAEIVAASHAKFPQYDFVVADVLCPEDLPEADIYFIKDVLQHWPSWAVRSWLDRFFAKRPNSRLLVCNCRGQPRERSLLFGGFIGLDGDKQPLRLFSPRELFSWKTKTLYELSRRTSKHDVLDALSVRDTTAAKIRLGRNWDGGYVLIACGEYDGFFAAGIGDDVSFERDVLSVHPSLRCEAWDPNPRISGFGVPTPRFVLHRKPAGVLPAGRELLVKMDIEGAEYPWFEALSNDDLSRIKQLVIELHSPFDDRGLALLRRLRERMNLIHIHGNNYAATRAIDGVTVPEIIEATYVRKDVLQTRDAPSFGAPTPLDRPNNPHAPEIEAF